MRNSGSGILLFADCLKLDRFTKKFVVPWIRFLLMIVAVEPFQKITDQLIPKKCSWKYLCLRFIKYFMLSFLISLDTEKHQLEVSCCFHLMIVCIFTATTNHIQDTFYHSYYCKHSTNDR